ncbi:MAG: DUF72 domain-containing protein [Trueperaceae bacterium]|nr:DUF72 domain-containing protein [Trueperaceae bacterium]
MPGRRYLGTSGWHYPSWKGPFYHEDAADDELLRHYACRVASAEINNTFYRPPDETALRDERETVPPGFRFALEASCYLTHIKKLNDPEEPLETFLLRISVANRRARPNARSGPVSVAAELGRRRGPVAGEARALDVAARPGDR